MPSKKKSKTAAAGATAADGTASAAKPKETKPQPSKKETSSPPTPPPPVLSLAELQQKLAEVSAARAQNAALGKALDEKLARAFKAPPKRVAAGITAAQIDAEMHKLELRRSTTSMSLNDEKFILRELQLLQDKKRQVEEFDKFQAWVDATKRERNERLAQNRLFDEQLAALQLGLRKATLAGKLGVDVAALETLEMALPEDKVGAVVGKGFAAARKLEAACDVLLDMESKSTLLKITGLPPHIARAKAAVEDTTLATTHTVGLHPDTLKVLMAQKAKNLQELEQQFGLKIDINKADGTLSTQAAPAKAKLLDRALKELEEAKVELQLPAEIVPKLIGKKGETINQLMEDTGCLVDIDKVTNAVRLCGTQESVAMAKKFVLQLVEDQSQREREFSVHDREFFASNDYAAFKFHFFAEFLMGNKGHQLKLLRTDASDAKIKVLKDRRLIHVLGNKAQLKAMEEALRERLREFENHHWLYEVPDNYLLSLIIGKKGAKIKQIEDEFKEGHVKIEIQDAHVCVYGDSRAVIDQARAKIMEIVDANQRSVFVTSPHLVSVLFNNKRAKLTEIEKTSGCKLNVPPGVLAQQQQQGGGGGAATTTDKVKITLTGTLEAISAAKDQLEKLDESHHVRYLPLDDDEVPTVIGKKGETISELEKKSGAKLRVLRDDAAAKDKDSTTRAPAELEMLGTQEQLAVVQREIDALLQTQNREILQLDPFATGCLIGKKGERIKTLRQAHPEANLDAFPARGTVRIKAANAEALKACVDHVLQYLRDTLVVESVRVPTAPEKKPENSGTRAPSSAAAANFNAILAKHPAIAARLQELEAEGGENTKVTIQDDGKLAKIRGSALAIGTLKAYLEMLVTLSEDAHFVETIKLPTASFGSVLLEKAADGSGSSLGTKLNENALRICKLTGCELRIKKQAVAGAKDGAHDAGGVVLIEGANPAKVYDAKDQVQRVLQFYHGDSIQVLDKLPSAAVPRLYELLPQLTAKYNVVFSLVDKTSLRVFTDSKHATKEVVSRLKQELDAWRKQHVEMAIPAWIVPVLLGKNGETIKKLAAGCNHAKLDLSPPTHEAPQQPQRGAQQEDRVLTVSARDDATVQLAVAKVKEFIELQKHRTSTLDVARAKLELVLSVKKEAPAGVQFHVVHATGKKEDGVVQIVLFGGEHEAREAVVEKMEHLLATSVLETIVLPASHATHSIVGALIGKSGANIRALQKEFPQVKIDIQRESRAISLKGPKDDVAQVKIVMEDKVQELLRQQEAFEERTRQHEEERSQQRRSKAAAPATGGANGGANGDGESTAEEPEEESKPAVAAAATPVRKQQQGPVGGPGLPDMAKLTKNQRRRMRKRAENEKNNDVLSMILGGGSDGDAKAAASAATANGDGGGYYHSSSGYSLRL